MSLTDKEEKYSQLVVSLGNKSEALRQSYDCSNMTDKTINEKASRLSNNDKISARIDELRVKEKEAHGVDRDFIIKGYLEIINDTNHVFKLADLKDSDTDASKRFYKLKSTAIKWIDKSFLSKKMKTLYIKKMEEKYQRIF